MLLRLIPIFVALLVESTFCQLPSPCPDIFKYEPRKEQNRWNGTLTLQTPEDLNGVWIHVILDRPAELLGNWFGEATSSDNQEYTIKNAKYKLEAGPPISVKFFVKYNPASVIPSLTSIRLNGKTICSSLKKDQYETGPQLHISQVKPVRSSSTTTTTERLPLDPYDDPNTTSDNNRRPTFDPLNDNKRPSSSSSSATSGRPQSPHRRRPTTSSNQRNPPDDGSENSNENFGTPDYFPGDFSLTRAPSSTSIIDSSSSSNKIACGTIALKPNPLISHGQSTEKGQWPWHAALYHSVVATQPKYICGGTLVSQEHVITAAHCVARPQTNRPVNLEIITVYLGKHTLRTFGSQVQERQVAKLFIHPQYNSTRLFNDIAILKLDTPVEFNNFVRPCCLWEGSNKGIETVVNKLGTVVGWGYDENGEIATDLMQAQMPIVSTDKCIFSNRDFFAQFTFEKNYCAGFRNGTTTCNGDSGSGMVFPRPDTSPPVWQLRGLVSLGVALQGKRCNPTSYAIFTDVAKHSEWIRDKLNE